MSDEVDSTDKTLETTNHLRKAVSGTCHRLQDDYFKSPELPACHQARASLAELRKTVSLDIMDNPLALAKVLFLMKEEFANQLAGKSDTPSNSERAAFVALTLFGLHMQSATKPMHEPGVSFATACGKLYARRSSDSIKPRVDAMLMANNEKSRLMHIRSLVSLLRSEQLTCDYGWLASDLCSLMNPQKRPGVQLRWGRDFAIGFKTAFNTEPETNNN